MYILKETESFVPEYNYQEEFDTYEEAKQRMSELYNELAVNGNSDVIEESGIHSHCAYISFIDYNEILWEIEEK